MKRISVTIPVYNEKNYIQKTLESIVGDADEIIIGDNASTDGTSDICQSFANKYPEIKYYRHNENIGQIPNNRFIYSKVTGKYVRKIGGHDMISVGSNHSMAKLLDENPDVIMVYSKIAVHLNYDYTYRSFYVYDEFGDDLMSDSMYVRIKSIINNCMNDASFFYGLYRHEIMYKSNHQVFQSLSTDRATLSSLAIKGKMMADDKSFFFWMHNHNEKSYHDARKKYKKKNTFLKNSISNAASWDFTVIAEHYNLFKETFGENSDSFNELFSILYPYRLKTIKENELTLKGMPPIIPGKEKLCQDVMDFLKKEYKNVANIHLRNKYKFSYINGDEDIIQSIKDINGFSIGETWGAWIDGSCATISFKLPYEIINNDIKINLDLSVFLNKKGKQKFGIYANNTLLEKRIVDNNENLNMEFIISSDFIKSFNNIYHVFAIKNRILIIKFIVYYPTSPLELGLSDDKRKLGIGIRNFLIQAIEQDNE